MAPRCCCWRSPACWAEDTSASSVVPIVLAANQPWAGGVVRSGSSEEAQPGSRRCYRRGVTISKTQIDRLGERLKAGSVQEQDLRDLDEYRRSFGSAYEHVRALIHERLGYAPTGRSAKTTPSIIEKLRRESIRLSQIQDIAGCRIVVLMMSNQEALVRSLQDLFANAAVIDRRQRPSHGYRAVHVVVTVDGRLIEIQVRTVLQHLWAQVSERYADVVDPRIKYGGGSEQIVSLLSTSRPGSRSWKTISWKMVHWRPLLEQGLAMHWIDYFSSRSISLVKRSDLWCF